MSAHYDWKSATHACEGCGWVGLGTDAVVGETFDHGAEYHCPRCDGYFGFVPYPLLTESLNDPRAPDSDRVFAEIALRRAKEDDDAP